MTVHCNHAHIIFYPTISIFIYSINIKETNFIQKISNEFILSKYIKLYSGYIVNIVVSLSNVSSEIIGISQSSSNFLVAGFFLKWIVFFNLQFQKYLLCFFHTSHVPPETSFYHLPVLSFQCFTWCNSTIQNDKFSFHSRIDIC